MPLQTQMRHSDNPSAGFTFRNSFSGLLPSPATSGKVESTGQQASKPEVPSDTLPSCSLSPGDAGTILISKVGDKVVSSSDEISMQTFNVMYGGEKSTSRHHHQRGHQPHLAFEKMKHLVDQQQSLEESSDKSDRSTTDVSANSAKPSHCLSVLIHLKDLL